MGKIKHGATMGRTTPEYRTWQRAANRCHNPNSEDFRDYGGRGIRVCDEWRNDFAAFLADMGPRPSPRHSIDRINVDGNYEPGNCRWATPTTQARNRRTSVNITFRGETKHVDEWAMETGIKAGTIRFRVRAGWSPERTLTEPVSNLRAGRVAHSKLTVSTVRQMRESFADGRASAAALARQHGVSPSTVSAILRGERWRHV